MSSLYTVALVLCLCSSARASGRNDGEQNYAVYFSVEDGKPNPWGEDYSPKSPSKWAEVDDEAWPIFVDWGDILDDTYWWDKGNQCQDRSDGKYSDKHRQSPIILTDDDRCKDTEPIIHSLKGKCDEDEVKFSTTPYGLNAEFSKCDEIPEIEHSLNDDPWKLVHMVVKVPTEHEVDNNGKVKRYDGEVQLFYKGSKDHDDKYSEGHAENIAVTSIFLEASSNKDDNELEKYIKGWKEYQENQYDQCEVKFDEKNCELEKTSSKSGKTKSKSDKSTSKSGKTKSKSGKTKSKSDKTTDKKICRSCHKNGCCEDRRALSSVFKFNHYDVQGQRRAELEALLHEKDQEIQKLREEVNACRAQSRKLNWRYARNDRHCKDSYFCPINLYSNTDTEFYWNYRGSLTVPPCTENVHWRILLDPLAISEKQLENLERLTYSHLEYPECELTTAGKPRETGRENQAMNEKRGNEKKKGKGGKSEKSKSGTAGCKVNVNRPIQGLSIKHNLQQCDSFSEAAFFEEEKEEEEEEEDPSKDKRLGGHRRV